MYGIDGCLGALLLANVVGCPSGLGYLLGGPNPSPEGLFIPFGALPA